MHLLPKGFKGINHVSTSVLLRVQVLALQLRSGALAGQPLPAAVGELDYPALINKALPDTIRMLGWADVPPDFSARWASGACPAAVQHALNALVCCCPACAASCWYRLLWLLLAVAVLLSLGQMRALHITVVCIH